MECKNTEIFFCKENSSKVFGFAGHMIRCNSSLWWESSDKQYLSE